MADLKRVLWYLLGGTRGGPLRIRILRHLRDDPCNTNQLAEALGIDYKTAQHHLKVLTENRVLSPVGEGYGVVYLPTANMDDSWATFDELAQKVLAKAERQARKKAAKEAANTPTAANRDASTAAPDARTASSRHDTSPSPETPEEEA